jgi:hypothetical protein
MALHPDLSDPALFDAFEDVRNENSPTNWYAIEMALLTILAANGTTKQIGSPRV